MRGQFITAGNGGLRIWRQPVPGKSYAIGVDSSAGLREGDYACAQVLDMENGEQVAEWHGHYRATIWGTCCARLGWHYNTAEVAIETHPSMYGLRAFDACYQYGYEKLWVQRRWDERESKYIAKKGWVRTPGSTVVMLERVRDMLARGAPIRSGELLDELGAICLDPVKGKIESNEHDDRVMAYAIAAIVVDDAWTSSTPEEEELPPARDMAEAYWRRQAELDKLGWPEERPAREEMYDGVDF